jgi:hypothetical protein
VLEWIFGDNQGQDIGEHDEQYEKDTCHDLGSRAREDERWRKSHGDISQEDWDKHTRKK